MSAAFLAATGRSRATIPAAVVLAALAALVVVGALRWPTSPERGHRAVEVDIGGRRLELDRRLIHAGPQRAGGPLERLDLIVGSSDFGPAVLVTTDARGRPAPRSGDAHLLISLQAAAGSDPATRAVAVHGRFVEPEVWSNPGGLVLRRFRAGTPFEGEELVMTPDGAEFAARCPVAGPQQAALGQRCLATFRVASIDVTVSFDASLLHQWRSIKSGAIRLVGGALR